MTLAVAPEAEVRLELWRSFIGVLKAYAALANIDAEAASAGNADKTPGGITWSAPSRDTLRLITFGVFYDAESGKGRWHIQSEDASAAAGNSDALAVYDFSLSPDGMVSTDRSTLDMDHAAIEMIGWFTSTIKAGKIEVPA